MADNIIRKDIIQLSFDVNDDGLSKANKQVDEFKKSFTGGFEKGIDKIKQSVNDINKATKGIGKNNGIDNLSKSATRFTKTFQSVNRSIQDGGNALAKFKSKITSLPHNTVNKISDGFVKMRLSAGVAAGTLKTVAKTKFSNLNADIKATKTALTEGQTGAKGFGNAIKNIGKIGVGKAVSGFENLKNKMKQSVPDAEKLKDKLKGVGDKLTDIGKKAAGAAFNGLKKLAGISFKAVTAGIGAAATAIGGLTFKSVQAYADYEQLVGGVETLFKDSAPIVQKYANDAYKTAGLSANDYMETVTGFSASLLQSLKGDTKKAAEYADMAVRDMADNSNKMGTDMSSIQYAYQGFAKQNYTMLDNLKLGYGGTKEEMQRLVKEASDMKDVQKELGITVDGTSMSYANIVKAIHVVQKNMGILGTTHDEAEKTITGSLNAMKSSWGNLLTAMASGENLDQCIKNMVDAVETFGNNVMPVAEKAIGGIGTLIERLVPKFETEFPKLAQKMLPPLIKAAVSLTKGLIKALPSLVKTVATTIVDIFGQQFPIIGKIGKFFENNAGKIANSITKIIIPAVIALVAAFKGFKAIKAISGLFGKGSGGGGGFFSGITNIFSGLAQTNTATVLKGMLNLTIILGGLGALVWTATKVFKQGIDMKQMLKVIALIGVFGLVGGALAKFAGIIGVIPIVTVLKGLANMGIVLGGLGALLFAATKVFKDGVNYAQMLQVIKLIGITGSVGSILSVFAGIVGIIPFPVVLAGLAKIGLVLGGITGLIAAFGKLSEAKGFNEFITKGGNALSLVFNQIGKIGGSLVGGLGEGISNSLPTIGKNLSAFAKSVSPMFDLFKGVDMSGVGSFFKSFGDFMLKMAGNKALSFFTGETNLADVGTQLSAFATNGSDFFNKVAALPENGFTNAKLMFETLSGIGNLPKSGGIKQWFGGETDFGALADGLGDLSNDNVRAFFETVTSIPQEGFNNAKLFFQSLSDIGNIPKAGGFKEWFSGSTDYGALADGLGDLTNDGVVSFFTTYGTMPSEYFTNAKNLFKALGNIDKLPKMSGWGGKGNNLTKLGETLKSFGDNAKGFFEKVNGINLSNLNGLWKSLSGASKISSDALKNVSNDIKDIIKQVSELPTKMGNGLKNAGKSLSSAMAEVWKDAVKASVAPVNKLLDAANWILKEFGSKKKVISWKPYAKGTDGHKGGNALVNDGRGAELVQMPNGRTFIPQGRNVFLPNAPKGMKVLPAEQTASLMGKKSPAFRYADGTGKVDIWEYYDNAQGLVDKVSEKVKYDGLSGFRLNLGKSIVSTFKTAMTPWVKKLFDEEGGKSLASYVASKGVEQWRSTVIRALKMEGQYSEANVKRTLYQMQTESGGNPRAINLWDSNAKKGIPSKGLMQCIDPTFKAYARPGFDKNIYDPLSNILASIRYAVSRYGSLAKAYQGHGYANGVGTVKMPEQSKTISFHYTPENSFGEGRANVTEHNTYSPVFNLTINGDTNDRATERKVKRWISEAMDEVFSSLERKNRRLQEV